MTQGSGSGTAPAFGGRRGWR